MKPLLILLWAACGQEPVEQQVAPPDPLAAYNLKFRADYAKTRAKFLGEAGPVIVVGGSSMALYEQLKRREAPTINDRYSQLKALSHIPLHVYVLLSNEKDGRLSEPVKKRLIVLRNEWAVLNLDLPKVGLAPPVLERNRRMIARTLEQTQGWVGDQVFESQALREFCGNQRKTIDANMLDAGRAQIETMDAAISIWRKELGPRWDKIKVVVRGMQMPRKDNLAIAYFAKLLGEKGECDRIVYGEGLSDDAAALSLLGTRLLDTQVGEVFFEDRLRMHRDLLGDAAKELLGQKP